jgi:hypothetical protein
MDRWTGKKVSRKRPARAITSFLDIEEKKVLLIVIEMFIVYLFALKGRLTKLEV